MTKRGSGADRRSGERIDVPGEIWLDSGEGRLGKLTDLSPGGVGFQLVGSAMPSGPTRARISLGDTIALEAQLELASSRPLAAQGVRFGARFVDLTHAAQVDISRALVGAAEYRKRLISRLDDAGGVVLDLREPADIRRVLRMHAVPGSTIAVYDNGVRRADGLQIETSVVTDTRFEIAVSSPNFEAAGLSSTLCVLPAGAHMLEFHSVIRPLSRNTWSVGCPIYILQKGFRSGWRSAVHDVVVARMSNPRTRRVVDSVVSNVAARGLALRVPSDAAFCSGDVLDPIVVFWGDKELRLCGVVRGVTAHGDQEYWTCGVEIVGHPSATARNAWLKRAFEAVHPHMTLASGRGFESAISCLESSGYIRMWLPDDERDHRSDYLEAWRCIQPRTGVTIVSREGAPAATAAATAIYPKTWLWHQLGIDRAGGEASDRRELMDTARELYRAAVFALEEFSGADYFLTYIAAEKRWTHLIFDGFLQRIGTQSACLFDRYTQLRSRTDPAHIETVERGVRVDVREATSREIDWLVDKLAGSLPAIQIHAFSYGREDFLLEDYSARCRKAGFERGRKALVASEGGEVALAVLAEHGRAGINLFGLLNMARPFFFVPGDARREALLRAVMPALRDHYRALGTTAFLVDDWYGTDQNVRESVGLELVAEGRRWLGSREVARAWLGYLDDMLRDMG